MTRISSKWTRFNKAIFPALWFGFLTIFIVSSFAFDKPAEAAVMLVAMPMAMMLFGFLLFRKLMWDLVDEVYDCGESLLVRNRGREERISLSNVMHVNVSTMMNPTRITLRLDKPSRNFGGEIAFAPETPPTINPFAKNRIGEDLVARVDRARRQPMQSGR